MATTRRGGHCRVGMTSCCCRIQALEIASGTSGSRPSLARRCLHGLVAPKVAGCHTYFVLEKLQELVWLPIVDLNAWKAKVFAFKRPLFARALTGG